MSRAHLILGETIDFMTGRTIADTHDERARQRIARFLVNEKGYLRKEIKTRVPLVLKIDDKTGTATIDFLVQLNGRSVMIVLFGPGSLVTRQRPTLAAARLTEKYMIPYAVISNGVDAQLLDVKSGKVVGIGLDAIVDRTTILKRFDRLDFEKISESRREKEARILYAMDILTQKECDEFTCTLC